MDITKTSIQIVNKQDGQLQQLVDNLLTFVLYFLNINKSIRVLLKGTPVFSRNNTILKLCIVVNTLCPIVFIFHNTMLLSLFIHHVHCMLLTTNNNVSPISMKLDRIQS